MLLLFVIVITFGMGAKYNFVRAIASSEYESVPGLLQLKSLIADRLAAQSEQIAIEYSGNKDELSRKLPSIMKQAMAADDYTAYIIDSYRYIIRTWSNNATVKISIVYRESKEQTTYVNRKVKNTVKSIIKPEMNDHEKVKAIHDWIIFNVKYDGQLKRYTAYEAIVSGKAVCQGYSLLASKMLKEAGIKNRIIEGEVSTGDHAWNLVLINGTWYHLDVTWDDPLPDRGNQAAYNYYLRTDEEMRQDHSWTKSYPKASKSYAETLTVLMKRDPSREAFYRDVEKELPFYWTKPENTITGADGLKKRIIEVAAAGDNSFKVRYLRGEQVEDDMKKAMYAVGSISTYRMKYSSFGNDGAVLLEVGFILGK
ncbi:transglutaminase domain-containing protein [Paenibacillus tarimensis]